MKYPNCNTKMLINESDIESPMDECYTRFNTCKYCSQVMPEDAKDNICGHVTCCMRKVEDLFI